MRFLTWATAVAVTLDGLEQSLFMRDGWRWAWVSMLVFFIFCGCVLALVGLARVVAGKSGAWLTRIGSGTTTRGPAPEIHKGGTP